MSIYDLPTAAVIHKPGRYANAIYDSKVVIDDSKGDD